MIYVTGDLHGDLSRLKSKEISRLKKGDTLIVCGDFGFLWDGSAAEKRRLNWIGRRRFNVLFVEGTHDNLALLEEYPVTEWNGGLVREIGGRLRQLCRGGVFTIEGKKIFAFGGGESSDADVRIPDRLWWENEMPSEQEIDLARRNLAEHGNAVDYIVTHEGSQKIKRFLRMHTNEAHALDMFLDEIRNGCRFKRWFFGCLHMNKLIPPVEFALFDAVVPIDVEKY